MRKVIDSNFLQRPELREYLAKSPRNFAVLTDYAAMEMYKGDALGSIYRRMEILADYPKQVIVLKGTQIVCGLRGRSTGLQRRMIDESQTGGFTTWCRQLDASRRGDDLTMRNQLLNKGREATAQMDRVLADAKRFAANLEAVSKIYSPAELKILRTNGVPYTEELFQKTVRNILFMAAFMFRDHPRITKLPSANTLPYTFIFRIALCYYFVSLALDFSWRRKERQTGKHS